MEYSPFCLSRGNKVVNNFSPLVNSEAGNLEHGISLGKFTDFIDERVDEVNPQCHHGD
jgi:hypothetical protein